VEQEPPAGPSVERDAIVHMKKGVLPPVDVGDWVCEPTAWGEEGQIRLHCSAPKGAKGLVEALRAQPGVESAESK
jgi:hypothetical protein